MICCENCFNDTELKSIIIGNKIKDNCPVCNSKQVFVYDTDKNTGLFDALENFISIYVPVSSLRKDYPKNKTKLLKTILLKDWNIFNSECKSKLAINILKELSIKRHLNKKIFNIPVGIPYSDEDLKQNSLIKTNRWEDFIKSIKEDNRFHTQVINTQVLADFCRYITEPLKKGTIFYRGRVSTEKGYKKKYMGAPPHNLASAGRVNSLGIPCLYLADSKDTVMHEIRATTFDYISIGTFKLKRDIKIVNLELLNKISPFIMLTEFNLVKYAINKKYFENINKEMGKPLRKTDSILEYLPTQYVSEFIKSISYNGNRVYSGLKYNSVLNKSGYNLAVFNPKYFECIKVELHEINEIKYRYKNMKL